MSFLTPFVRWERLQRWAIAGVAVWTAVYIWSLAAGTLPFDRFGSAVGGDYAGFYSTGRLVASGRGSQIYSLTRAPAPASRPQYLAPEEPRGAFLKPPFYGLVFVPFSWLPYLWSFALWAALSVLALIGALFTLRKHVALVRDHFVCILAVSLCFVPAIEALRDGEDSLLSLLLMALFYRSLTDNHDGRAGIFAGLGLYKPQLFAVLPILLLLDRRWSALAAYAATAAGLAGLSVAAGGRNGLIDWLRLLASPAYQSNNVAPFPNRINSLKGAIELLLGGSSPVATAITIVASAAILGSALWCWWRAGTRDPVLRQIGFAQAVVAGLLVSLHLFKYELAILILPALLILDAAWQRGAPWQQRAVLVVLGAYGLLYLFPESAGRLQVATLAMIVLYLFAIAFGRATMQIAHVTGTG